MNSILKSLITLLVLFCVMPAATATGKLPPQWTELLADFDGLLEDDHIVGGCIALVRDGRIVSRRHYGFADLDGGRRVDEDTLFHWASISKTLNAIATMQLRDRGLLSLDEPLTNHVPELRHMHNVHGSMDDITVAMVLEHSTGLQAPTWPYKQGEPWEPFEPKHWAQLVAMMPYQQIAFPPGSRFSYSNPSWIYLARILEERTGDPWDAYIHKNIFAPLGMSRSYFRSTPYHLGEHRSHHYLVRRDEAGNVQAVDQGPDFDPGITVPNGGWNSPLADVAAYIGFLTGSTGGSAERKRRFDVVLARATVEEMWQPRQPLGDGRSSLREDAMGLGFFIKRDGDSRVIGHTGGQGGFTSMMYFNPQTRLGVVAAFNTVSEFETEGRIRAFRQIQQRVFGLLHSTSRP